MNLLQCVAQWLRPFYSTPMPDRRRSSQQRQEDERLLRQLRAELELMRRWKDAERHGK